MGYAVYIVRKAEGEGGEQKRAAAITLAEWKAYVATDPELRLTDYAEASGYGAGPGSAAGAAGADLGALPAEAEVLSLWLAYSRMRAGKYAWFSYARGRVTVRDPDEELLGKILAVAQALAARVQGDDGEYFDEAPASRLSTLVGAGFGGAPDFRDFQTFASAEAAQPVLEMLARQGIAARTTFNNGRLAFDPSFANNQLTSKFIISLPLADFERAGQLLADMNQHALSEADPNHYLFGFADEELFDVVLKPDEWSSFDVALAGQLLRQRGRDVSADTLRLLRQHRVAELAQPDKDHRAWILGGYLSALLGGFFGLLIGYQLYSHHKQLPDGRRVYAYSATDRVHGLRIMVLAGIVLLVVVSVRIGRTLSDN